MPIKTLHITNSFHQKSGGISTFYRALLKTANGLGRKMVLVVPGDQTRVETSGEFGRIHYVKAPQAPFFDRRYRMLMPQNYLPGLGGTIKRILLDEQPDLIEICDKYSVSWLAGLLRRGWLSGISRPVLAGISCERMDDNVGAFLSRGNAGKRWSQRYLGHLYIPLFDYHIANSQYTANELLSAMLPKHQRPVHVLPMGAEIDEFSASLRTSPPNNGKRRQLIAQVGGNERTRLLLYAGRFSPEKNVPLLIEMMECLAGGNPNRVSQSGVSRNHFGPSDFSSGDFKLIVAGSGPLLDWFESETSRRLPSRVLSLGHVQDRGALVSLYANCDAFVHPNPREPFGIAPLEAMAAGLPLVAPQSGGVLSYADETNAWLTEANGESFAAAVQSIFRDSSTRKDKLARARWVAAQFRWDDVAARFFALYDDLHSDFPNSRFARQRNSKQPPETAGKLIHETYE